MTDSISKQAQLITKRHPFLANFPFKEFSIELEEMTNSIGFSMIDEYEDVRAPKLIRFVHKTEGGASVAIVVFEPELEWIRTTSDRIQEMDKIAKSLDEAINSDDLLKKRDAADLAAIWYSQLEDDHTRLSYSTMSDILVSLIRNQDELVSVINKIAGLSLKTGLINLTKKEYQIILTYYHFQLIYAKLILGLVIASKISI